MHILPTLVRHTCINADRAIRTRRGMKRQPYSYRRDMVKQIVKRFGTSSTTSTTTVTNTDFLAKLYT